MSTYFIRLSSFGLYPWISGSCTCSRNLVTVQLVLVAVFNVDDDVKSHYWVDETAYNTTLGLGLGCLWKQSTEKFHFLVAFPWLKSHVDYKHSPIDGIVLGCLTLIAVAKIMNSERLNDCLCAKGETVWKFLTTTWPTHWSDEDEKKERKKERTKKERKKERKKGRDHKKGHMQQMRK